MSLYEQLRTAQDLTFGFSVITGLVKENWEHIAGKWGLSRSACEYMRPAFDICNK